MTAVNAISLAIAGIANLALLLNMGGYLRFIIAQPIVILGWYLSSFLLISLVILISSLNQAPRGNTLSQAFYYAIFAAVLYFIISSLMVISLYGAYFGHYSQYFLSSMGQMSLMAQTISFAVYLLGGAAIFARIEGWLFLDTVYWADYTILTVGIGEIAPKTHLGRSLLFPYAVGGVIILGLIITSIQSFTSDRGKKKLSIMTQRKYMMFIKQNRNQNTFASPNVNAKNLPSTQDGSSTSLKRNSKWAISKAEFSMMRSIQKNVAKRHRWKLFLSSIFTWFVLWLASAAAFRRAEHGQNWSYFEALYFTYTSLMTIGYGDIYPKSNFGKSFFVFWSLLAVPILTILISSMGGTMLKLITEVAVWVSHYALIIGESGLGGSLKHIRISPKPDKDIPSNDDDAAQNPASLDEKTKGKKTDEGEDNVKSNWPGRVGDEQIGGQLGQNTPHYNYLLVEEIANVVHDLSASRERQYTYEEWTWFIALISAGDESGGFDGVVLAAPNSHAHSAELEIEKESDGREQDLGVAAQEDGDAEEGESRQWGWFGSQSPLMGEKTEPEWVLEHLSATLKRGLKRQLNRGSKNLFYGDSNSAFRGRLVPGSGESSFN